jgi:hypothetical protein
MKAFLIPFAVYLAGVMTVVAWHNQAQKDFTKVLTGEMFK